VLLRDGDGVIGTHRMRSEFAGVRVTG